MFAFQDLFKSSYGIGHGNKFTFGSCKLSGDEERLRKESLNLSGTADRQLVLFRKFIHTQNGDDVLQIFIFLQGHLYLPGNLIMFVTDNVRIKNT